MKRKDRGLLIVSGIVSLASQLPSCKSASNKNSSDVLDANSNTPKCGIEAEGVVSAQVKNACAAVIKWVADSKDFDATDVKINRNGKIQIDFATLRQKDDAIEAMKGNLHFKFDSNTGIWNYYLDINDAKGGSNGKGGGKGGSIDPAANPIVLYVPGNDKGGGKGGKGGN